MGPFCPGEQNTGRRICRLEMLVHTRWFIRPGSICGGLTASKHRTLEGQVQMASICFVFLVLPTTCYYDLFFLHYMPQVLPLSFYFLHCCLCFLDKVSLSSYIRFLFVMSSTSNSNSVGSNFILHVCSYSTFIMVEKAAERKLLI